MKTDWTGYWTQAQDSRFTRISWSKRRIMEILDKYIKPGSRVLDAGCGSGFFSHYFNEQGCQTYCLDYSPKALDIARELTHNKCYQYLSVDMLTPGLASHLDKKVDLIFTDGLFEHFSDEQQQTILANFKSVLNTDGVIVTVVPHLYSWWTVVRPIFMPQIEEKPFTTNRLIHMHANASLTMLEHGGLNVLPFGISPEGLGEHCGMLLYYVGK